MKKFHFDLIVSSVVLVAMIVVILIQIIFRLMGNPLSWTEEVARWMLVWATFAGASYAFKNGGLIRVDFFVKKLFKKKGRRITDIAAMMFMIVYFGLLGVSAERPSGCLHRTAYRTYNAWQWDEGGHISPENVCFC